MITKTLCKQLCRLTKEEWLAVSVQLNHAFKAAGLADNYSCSARRCTSGIDHQRLFSRINSFLEGYRALDPTYKTCQGERQVITMHKLLSALLYMGFGVFVGFLVAAILTASKYD